MAMNRLCRQVKRFVKVGKFTGRVFQATNAMPQGCCWSVLSILMHMTVWHRDLATRAPRAVAYSYYDDPNPHGPDAETVDSTLQVSIEFDFFSGGLLNGDKSVSFAVGDGLRQHVQQMQLYGVPISMVASGKLLGALVAFANEFPEEQQDERLRRLSAILRRIRRAPGPQQVRGYLVEVFAAAAMSSGAEYGSYSHLTKQDYMKVLRETLWNCDNHWPNMAVAQAILFKGHRMDVEAIELLETLRIWRRQMQRDASTKDLLQQAWELKSANPDFDTYGALSRLVHVVEALGWSWPSFDTFQRPSQITLHCMDPRNVFDHQLRETYRQRTLAAGTHRNDNSGQHAGLDYDLTVAWLRHWEKHPTSKTPLRIGILRNCLGGALHS